MGIEVIWDDTLENVIVYHFQGRWTWQEFLMGFEQELGMAKGLDGARYDVIGNLIESHPLPPGSGISHVYGIFKRYPGNWGVTLIVSGSAFIRAMLNVGTKVHPDARNGFIISDTVENARAIIRQKRAEAVKQAKP